MLVRVKLARVTAIWLYWRPLLEIDEIVHEYDRKQFQLLVYVALSRVIFNMVFNVVRVCGSRYDL